MTNLKPTVMSLVAVVLCGLAAVANAIPLVDGKFDPSEGYTDGFWLNLAVESGKTSTVDVDDGRLWLYQDLDNNLYVNLTLPLPLVDNTYGENRIGWGKHVAPSGKNHNFEDLTDSDGARFCIYDGDGDVVLDFVLDYISSSDSAISGYATGGVEDGEGRINVGSVGDIIEVGTSLDYNFNTLGHVLTEDSPATDEEYTENSEYAGWLFEVSYEFKIDGDVFGGKGLGDITIPLMHVSPNKIARNKVFYDGGYPVTGPVSPVPEPASMVLLGLGSIALLPNRRR